MREIVLAKYGEIVLKGLNRGHFESVLIKNVKNTLKPLGRFDYFNIQSTLYITPLDEDDGFFEPMSRRVAQELKRVFGFATIVVAVEAEKNLEDISRVVLDYVEDKLDGVKTFKVEAKRSDKRFPLKSPEIAAEIGGVILTKYPHLKVDVHNPQFTVNVEIRDKAAYIHAGGEKGAGGVPVGTSGNGTLMLSGGIDSPVAGYMMAKRGMQLSAVYFATPPYTSDRATDKVVRLAKILAKYAGWVSLYVANFTEYQEQLAKHCPQEYFTILMRRGMMRVAEKIALHEGAGALITGESLAQVASQTLTAMAVTENAIDMPVFRPCIGMDKEEIVEISRKMGAFDTSIEPYDDCCAMFSPRHPKLSPKLEDVLAAEAKLDIEGLVERCADSAERVRF